MAFACLTWAAMIWRIGYFFGDGDHEEVLGQILYRMGTTQLSADFLIHSIGNGWTVRTPFVLLMSVFGKSLIEPAFLFFHFALNTAMFYAMIRICRSVADTMWAVFCPLFVVFMLYAKSPGANDFYTPQLIAESFSMFFAMWAIKSWFEGKLKWIGIWLFLALLFHPINGMHVFFLLFAAWAFQDFRTLKIHLKYWLAPALLGAGYILWLSIESSGESVGSGYFDLLVRFRNPHHYLPSAFPTEQVVLSVLLAGLAIAFTRHRHRFVRTWVFVIAGLSLLYFVCVEYAESTTIAKLQWFKTSIWLRLWAVVALISWLPSLKSNLQRYATSGAVVLTGIILLIVVRESENKYHKSIRTIKDINLVDVGVRASELLPAHAVCAVPMDITGFQAYSLRGQYVSFKAILHYPVFLEEWFIRLTQLYGPLDRKRSGFAQFSEANTWFEDLDTARIEDWRKSGITHILTRKSHDEDLNLVYRNPGFYLYEIPEPRK